MNKMNVDKWKRMVSGVDETIDKGLEWQYNEEETNSMDLTQVLPFAFRGRDFNCHLHTFHYPFYELMETEVLLLTKFPFPCHCRVFSKCQRLIIHNPISPKYCQYTLLNPDKVKLNINHHQMKLGTSSRTILTQLTQHDANTSIEDNKKEKEKLIIAETISVFVSVDEKTHRPVASCDNTKRLMEMKIKNGGSKIEKEMDTFDKIRLPLFRESCDYLQKKMDSIYNINSSSINSSDYNYNRQKALFKREFDIRVSNMDFNGHVNQGIYCRRVEDTLYEYSCLFFRGLKFIKYFDQIFINEMKYQESDLLFKNDLKLKQKSVEYNNVSKCVVKFWFDESNVQLMCDKQVTLDGDYTSELIKNCQRIIGSIEQNDKPCLFFCVVLVDTPKDSLYTFPDAKFASKL